MSVAPSRTNGFLFADLRDYTRYVESYGDQSAAALLEAYRSLVRAAVAEHGGAEIKTEGDSFYVVFPSASTAVQCGLAIIQASADARQAAGAPIRVGIGVHAGETVETAEGYVGSAVNVAARVCSQAKSGELLVTDTVRALTRTFLPVRFVDRRTRRLKGIAEPMVLYRVEPLEAGATIARPGRRRLLGRPATIGVVVLGLLIGAAGAGYVLVAVQQPTPSPGPTDGIGSSVSPESSATFPTALETDLLFQIPAEIRDSCHRTEDPAARIGIISAQCDLELAAEVDTVWYDRFESLQSLSTAFLSITETQVLPRGDCGPEVSRAQGNWQVGSTHTGRLLCYQAEGSTWIVWSYDADRIAARAVRSGDGPEDWQALYEWWSQVRLFLR